MVLHCSCSVVELWKICKSLSVLLSILGIPNHRSSSDHHLMVPAPKTASAFIQEWFNTKYKIYFREADLHHTLPVPFPLSIKTRKVEILEMPPLPTPVCRAQLCFPTSRTILFTPCPSSAAEPSTMSWLE